LQEDRFRAIFSRMIPMDNDSLNEIEKRLAQIEKRLLDVEKELSYDVRRDATTRRFNMWIRIGVYALGLLLILFLFLLMKWDILTF
jgi:tetrahydromethanopterin S-methyltransferase subunit G